MTRLAPVAFEWDAAAPSAHAYLAPGILAALHRLAARRVLDLGCGNGSLTARIAATGYDVSGVDGSTTGITLARELIPGAALLAAPLELPLPESFHGAFDVVVAVEVIEHLLVPDAVCDRAGEALAPGGTSS